VAGLDTAMLANNQSAHHYYGQNTVFHGHDSLDMGATSNSLVYYNMYEQPSFNQRMVCQSQQLNRHSSGGGSASNVPRNTSSLQSSSQKDSTACLKPSDPNQVV